MSKMNGHSLPLIGGAAALGGGSRPVVGHVRARITRPLNHVEPDYRGRAGRAWQARLELIRERLIRAGRASQDAMIAHWIVEAPWSHQVIHSYSIVLLHLRHMMGKQPVTRYLEGATHEVHLRAIHPMADRGEMLRGPVNKGNWLEPVVFAAQIVEASDESAAQRVRRAVELVCDGRVSPEISHVRTWAQLFGDNMLRLAVAPQPTEEK
jgi:hypothetical protein